MTNIDIDTLIENTSTLSSQMIQKTLLAFPVGLFEKALKHTPEPNHHKYMSVTLAQKLTRSMLDHVERSDDLSWSVDEIKSRAKKFDAAKLWGKIEGSMWFEDEYKKMQSGIEDMLSVTPKHTPPSLQEFKGVFKVAFEQIPPSKRKPLNIIDRAHQCYEEERRGGVASALKVSSSLSHTVQDLARHLTQDDYEKFKIKINNNLHLKHMQPSFDAQKFIHGVGELMLREICLQLHIPLSYWGGELFEYQDKQYRKWFKQVQDFQSRKQKEQEDAINGYGLDVRKQIRAMNTSVFWTNQLHEDFKKDVLMEAMFGSSHLNTYMSMIENERSQDNEDNIGVSVPALTTKERLKHSFKGSS